MDLGTESSDVGGSEGHHEATEAVQTRHAQPALCGQVWMHEGGGQHAGVGVYGDEDNKVYLCHFRSLVTEFPFHPPGIQSNRQEGLQSSTGGLKVQGIMTYSFYRNHV